MALPAPDLDDRRYADLVADAVRLVHRSAPDWTDENPADAGLTLIEAYAYLTDQLIRRLNQVPDRLYLKFLDLIGLRLVPATPARVPVTFWLAGPATSPVSVPRGTEIGTARDVSAEPVVFTTGRDLVVPPCKVTEVLTRTAAAAEPVERTLGAGPVAVFAGPPEPGDELLIGLDVAVPRVAVRLEYTGETEGLGIDPADPPLEWAAWTGSSWADCAADRDETGGLNHSGSLVLHVPQGHTTTVIAGRQAGWLRARVIEPGEGRPGYTASPRVRSLAASSVGGTVEAIHAELVFDEPLGESAGVPGQVFTVEAAPVLGGLGPAVVEVGSADGWQEWTEVGDFAGSGPGDRHFRFDHVTGEIAFGPAVRQPDGTVRRHGAVPPRGEPVRLRCYGTGGGRRGNVPRSAIGTLKTAVPRVLAVENRVAARGGADAETTAEARDRAPVLLRTRSRAVTAEDYELLAREAVPEAARIRCITADDAGTGAVRVLVVPAAAQPDGVISFPDLIPPESLLRRVAERLDQVRLVGTRVSVEPPRYRGVTVVARLVARPRVDPERIRAEATAAVYRYLSPLPGGGPDGTGWEFGRTVRGGDVYAVLRAVRGVADVEDVRLFSANPVSGERGSEQVRIELERNSLVFSFEHQLKVEAS